MERSARLKANGGHHTAAEWTAIRDRYGNTCVRCGRPEPEIRLTKDHIVPVCMGGTNNAENLQPLCDDCHFIKGQTTTDYRGSTPSRPEGPQGTPPRRKMGRPMSPGPRRIGVHVLLPKSLLAWARRQPGGLSDTCRRAIVDEMGRR